MDFDDFAKQLKQQDFSTMMILQLALTMGVIIFSGVVVLLFVIGLNEPANSDVSLINTLSIAVGAMAFSAISLFTIIPKIRYKKDVLQGIFESDDSVGNFMIQFRTTRIIQIAILEGAALFGVVNCLLAVINGVMVNHSIYWLNLIPAALMVLISLANFPSKAHLHGHYKYLSDNYSLMKK